MKVAFGGTVPFFERSNVFSLIGFSSVSVGSSKACPSAMSITSSAFFSCSSQFVFSLCYSHQLSDHYFHKSCKLDIRGDPRIFSFEGSGIVSYTVLLTSVT